MSEMVPSSVLSAKWQERFDAIDALPKNPLTGRPSLSMRPQKSRPKFSSQFSVAGFIFGPFYYIYLKMYHKAALLFAGMFILIGIVQLLESITGYEMPKNLNRAMAFILPAFCAQMVAFDYFKFIRFGDRYWGRAAWLNSTLSVALVTAGAALFMIVTLFAMDAPEDILSEVGGVWRSNNNVVAEINLGGNFKTIAWGENLLSCKLKNADTGSHIVVLNCKGAAPNNYLVALRQIYNTSGDSFTLGIRFGNAEEDVMSYMRPL